MEKHGLGTLEVTDLYGLINAAKSELDARHESGKRKGSYVLWGRGRAVKQAEVDGLEAIKTEAIEAYKAAYATATGEPVATGTTG